MNQRILKFRAWNDDSKRMIYLNAFEWGLSSLKSSLKWFVMQFTGLFDKNGKEIWEGDILTTPAGRGSVKWIEGAWYLSWPTDGDTTLYDCPISRLEVIGNLWENHELLGCPHNGPTMTHSNSEIECLSCNEIIGKRNDKADLAEVKTV